MSNIDNLSMFSSITENNSKNTIDKVSRIHKFYKQAYDRANCDEEKCLKKLSYYYFFTDSVINKGNNIYCNKIKEFDENINDIMNYKSFYEALDYKLDVHLFFDIDKPITREQYIMFKQIGKDIGSKCSIVGYYNNNFDINIIKDVMDEDDYLYHNEKAYKSISLHIVYYESLYRYNQFPDNINDYCLIDKYNILNDILDLSVYEKNSLFRHPYYNKNTKPKKGHTVEQDCLIGIKSLSKDLFKKQFVQNVNKVNTYTKINIFKHKDNSECETKTNKSLSNETNKPTNDNQLVVKNNVLHSEKNKLYDNCDAIINYKRFILKLLNEVCEYVGRENIVSEIRNYIPNNELKMYGTNYFETLYKEQYYKFDHVSLDDFKTLYNDKKRHGLLYCLTMINKNICKKYENIEDKKEYDILIRYMKEVERMYLIRYKLNESKSSYYKFMDMKEEYYKKGLIEHIKLSQHYRSLYILKIMFTHEGDYYLKMDNNKFIRFDKNNAKVADQIKRLLNINKLENFNLYNEVRIIKTLNEQNNNDNNYDMINLNYFTDKINNYTNDDFIEFEKVLFDETFKDKECGKFAKDILYFDIFNKFTIGYNIVVGYYGNGANCKTAEAMLYSNIIDNNNYVMFPMMQNYCKEQILPILKNKFICLEELAKDNKMFNNMIDKIKNNSQPGEKTTREMHGNDVNIFVECRHRFNTNNSTLLFKYAKDHIDEKAFRRRFFIAERITPDHERVKKYGGLCYNKQFCKEYAKWVYAKKDTYKPVYKINEPDILISFNQNAMFFKEAEDSVKDIFIKSLNNEVTQKGYLTIKDYNDKSNCIYRVDTNKGLKAFNEYSINVLNKRKVSRDTYLNNYVKRYCKTTRTYYDCNGNKKNSKVQFYYVDDYDNNEDDEAEDMDKHSNKNNYLNNNFNEYF